MPYEHAYTFNETLTQLSNSPCTDKMQMFCQSFIATFNADTKAAKLIGTGKLQMSDSKKEEAAQLASIAAMDVVGFFGVVPTGVLGKVVEKAISAVFKGIRKKDYKKIAGLGAHMTHVELLSQALVIGLMLHYKEALLDEDTLKDPKQWGQKTVKRLFKSLKSNSEKSLSLATDNTLTEHLKIMLAWCVNKDYVREEPDTNNTVLSYTDDDYATLLLFAAAELLGLDRKYFVDAQQQKDSLTQLESKLQAMEDAFTNVKAVYEEQLKQNARPKDIIKALEEEATNEGSVSINYNSLIQPISADLPSDAIQQTNLKELIDLINKNSREAVREQREAHTGRDLYFTAVPKGSTNKGTVEANLHSLVFNYKLNSSSISNSVQQTTEPFPKKKPKETTSSLPDKNEKAKNTPDNQAQTDTLSLGE